MNTEVTKNLKFLDHLKILKEVLFLSFYNLLTLVIIVLFLKTALMQIDLAKLFIPSICASLVLSIFVWRFLSRAPFANRMKYRKLILALNVVPLFILSSMSYTTIIAFVNQRLDQSVENSKESFLVIDEKVSKEKNKSCFRVAHFEDPEASFGNKNLCDNNFKPGMKVVVSYKEGLFSARWATKITLK